MIHSIRSESVVDRWALVVERGGRHEDRFLHFVARRVGRARVWGVDAAEAQVRMGSLRGPVAHALVFRHRRCRDLRCYVSARSLGRHLEIQRLAALEPNWIKRSLAALMRGGAWWAWSFPQGLDREASLQSFLAIVDRCIADTAKAMAARLAPSGHGSRTRVRDVLDLWDG